MRCCGVRTRLALLLMLPLAAPGYRVKIGVVSGPGSDRSQHSEKFWSFGRDLSSSVVLEPLVYEVPYWGALEIAKAVCQAAKDGARGLVAQAPPRLGPLLATYSDRLRLPLALDSSVHSMGPLHVSLLPDSVPAASALLRHYQWSSFAFIYDTDHGADELQAILRHMEDGPDVEAFWRAYNAEEAAAFARHLPPDAGRLLLATSEETADRLFDKLAASGRSFRGILLQPVGTVQRGSTQGLTKFSVVDDASGLLKDFENRWKTLETHRPSDLPDSALLVHDMSRVLHSAFTRLSQSHPALLTAHVPPDVECFNYSSGLPDSVEPFQRNVVLGRGVTGNLLFNEQGRRAGYSLNILESTSFGLHKIGTWSDGVGLKILEEVTPTPAFQKSDPPIRVTSILTTPFLKQNPDGTLEGYVMDFLNELTLVTGRRFQLQLVRDSYYGIFRNGRWNGMIGELIDNETDMIIADLTKTQTRESAVYFSKSFMTSGLNVLLSKPRGPHEDEPSSFGPFSFLTVWPVELWMGVVLAVMLFGAACYGVARWLGAPDRVRALESKSTDSLSPCGSLWFTVGALFQRDTGIYPRSFTHRVWALLWWTFCLFVLVSYVSALTASLLSTRTHVTSIHSPKTSHEILEELLQKGSPATGVVMGGSTMQFFKNSNVGVHRDFGRYLEDHPDVMARSLSEAADRVRTSKGSYAFITESTGVEFAANQPPCDLLASSGYFTTTSFAPVLRKNSSLREVMDHGVLTLMESGVLRQLYEKWWHNFTDRCEDPSMDILPKVYSQSMTLHEMSGVFYILLAGALLSVGAALVEHYATHNRMSLT